MTRKRFHSNVKIVDNDEIDTTLRGSDTQLSAELVEDPLQVEEESDADEAPVVVNAHEFLQAKRIGAEGRKRSLTPPRRTVQNDNDDDVVYRDKSGRRITREQWLLLQGNRSLKHKRSEPAQELEWGKGIVQKLDKEAQQLEESKLASQPLSRYDIDIDYDSQLKNQIRWEDPMLKKKAPVQVSNEPKSRFTGIANRFNIQPGYRWDGVIRGNGYEKRWFKVQADKAAKKQVYYMNNIADM